MANLQGTYSLTSYHPNVDWKISYSQTARTSTTATYNFTVSMTLKTGTDIGYGYNIFLSLSQGGTTKVNAHRLKADGNTDMYAGTWSTTFSATLTTDASGGTIPSIRIWSTSTQDPTHYQQALDITGEVTKTVYGTAPSSPFNVYVSGAFAVGSEMTIQWQPSSGATGYKLYYSQKQNGSWNNWSYLKDVTAASATYIFTTIGDDRTDVKFGVSAVNSIGESSIAESNVIARSFIKVWNGSAYINGKATVWDGSAWKPATIKIWDGTSWTISK